MRASLGNYRDLLEHRPPMLMAGPEGYLDDRSKRRDVFSYLVPERHTAFEIQEDFNVYTEC